MRTMTFLPQIRPAHQILPADVSGTFDIPFLGSSCLQYLPQLGFACRVGTQRIRRGLMLGWMNRTSASSGIICSHILPRFRSCLGRCRAPRPGWRFGSAPAGACPVLAHDEALVFVDGRLS
jgi:hypothetical protein